MASERAAWKHLILVDSATSLTSNGRSCKKKQRTEQDQVVKLEPGSMDPGCPTNEYLNMMVEVNAGLE